jgi:hypothetical protein
MAKRTPSSPIAFSVATFSASPAISTRSVTSSSTWRPSRLFSFRMDFNFSV